MTSQRRMRHMALAAILSLGCAGQVARQVVGAGAGGTGGGSSSSTGKGGSAGSQVCNGNPDPCCHCLSSGLGGNGTATCLGGDVPCEAAMICAAVPTAECCLCAPNPDQLAACHQAGFTHNNACSCTHDSECGPGAVCDTFSATCTLAGAGDAGGGFDSGG